MAFAGFRHGHIFELYRLAQEWEELEVVAAGEDHAPTREEIRQKGLAEITHENIEAMLDQVECDTVAVGDYFARRGKWVIRALERGRHAIGDKPLCTRLEELERIEDLAGKTGLKVGCMLTMRDSAAANGARALIRAGRIGELHAIAFGGQHPLLLGSRPSWYFEPGKHGGTIADIGIHAMDALPWITGLEFKTINAARCWNALVPEHPHFHDAAQMMLTMGNGCGVLGDVSYLAPDRAGYSMPFYWRMTFWGREGVLETSATAREILVLGADDEEVRHEPLPPAREGGYARAFLDDIQGKKPENGLDTQAVLCSMRQALRVQRAADRGEREVSLAS
jgi:predicted dehydrogenase